MFGCVLRVHLAVFGVFKGVLRVFCSVNVFWGVWSRFVFWCLHVFKDKIELFSVHQCI